MTDCELIVGVSAGIAAYKTAQLVSSLVQMDANVTVVMTPRAGTFVSSTTFAALSGRPVATDLFDPSYPLGAHIELARRAKLLCVAPASADFLARGHRNAAGLTVSASLPEAVEQVVRKLAALDDRISA